MPTRPAHRPAIVTAVAVASLGGLVLGRFGWRVSTPVLIGVGFVTIAAWWSRFWWLPLIVLGLLLGLWRAEVYRSEQAVLKTQIGYEVNLTGVVVTDPLVNAKHESDYRVGDLRENGRGLVGIIRILSTPVRLERGYRVALQGKLEDGYATWDGELFYPKMETLSSSQSLLERWRQSFFLGIHTALPEPNASFGLGLLIGVGALIPKPLQTELIRVGLSHLVAVSGYNLTIIVRLVVRVLGRLGRNVALVLSLWLICVFVVISGASSSIVRAGVVSILSLVVGHMGRKVEAVALVAVAAAGTALYNPAYFNDVGWLLSFLAFFGILVVAPAILTRMGEPRLVLVKMMVETLAAEILTLPIIVAEFSQLSVIGLVANLVVEPFVPLAMLVSVVAGLAGLWLPAWSGYLAAPANLILGFILQLVGAMAVLPWALSLISLTTVQMIECYAVMLVLTVFLIWSNRRRR